MTTANAIDVSQWQGRIDWTKVKGAGFTAAAIRSSYGKSGTDSYFIENAKGAKAVGLHTIYYHYAYPELNSAIDEANHFIAKVNEVGLPDGPLMLDIEQGTGDVSAWVVAFLDHVHQTLNHDVVWYSYDGFISAHLSSVHIPYEDWVANYSTKPTHKWYAWQMSDKGQVPGINGYVDLDYMPSSFLDIKPKTEPKPLPVEAKTLPPVPPVEHKKPPQPIVHKSLTFMMNKGNIMTLVVAVVGATKLILQAFGVDLGITGAETNTLANAIAGVATTMGIFLTHSK